LKLGASSLRKIVKEEFNLSIEEQKIFNKEFKNILFNAYAR